MARMAWICGTHDTPVRLPAGLPLSSCLSLQVLANAAPLSYGITVGVAQIKHRFKLLELITVFQRIYDLIHLLK